MLRSSLTTLGVVLLGATALAQADLSSRVRPITSPVKNAGTLNLATGQWTRATNGQAAIAGAHIVYSNTCFSGYYGGMTSGENWTDEGAIPNPDMLQTPSVVIPGGFDTEPGCADTYNINGFQIGYCTYQAVPFSVTIKFFDIYQIFPTFCTPKPVAPTQSFLITGLPATSVQLTQACWLVGFDLTAGTPSNFTLTGTNDPSGTFVAANEQFGWSFVLNGASDALLPDGTILAGFQFACTGSDATRWDIRGTASVNWPANVQPGPVIPAAQEEGGGMLQSDAFRTDGPTAAPSGPGCYYFGGNPNASFHLELYSDVDCPSTVGTPFCGGGQIPTCPCGPSTAPTNEGCLNQSGGNAVLTATGNASTTGDTLQLNLADAAQNVSLAIFIQGQGSQAPVANGNGYVCVNQFIRLNGAPGTTGAHDATSPTGGLVYPHAGSTHSQSVSAQSNTLAAPISPGQTRHYQVVYRDPPAGGCIGTASTNWSNALSITWN